MIDLLELAGLLKRIRELLEEIGIDYIAIKVAKK